MKASVDIQCNDGESTEGDLIRCMSRIENENDGKALGIAIAVALAGTTVVRPLDVLANAVQWINDTLGDSDTDDGGEEEKFVAAAIQVVEMWDEHDEQMKAEMAEAGTKSL